MIRCGILKQGAAERQQQEQCFQKEAKLIVNRVKKKIQN